MILVFEDAFDGFVLGLSRLGEMLAFSFVVVAGEHGHFGVFGVFVGADGPDAKLFFCVEGLSVGGRESGYD